MKITHREIQKPAPPSLPSASPSDDIRAAEARRRAITTAAPNGYIPPLPDKQLQFFEDHFKVDVPDEEKLLNENPKRAVLRGTAKPIFDWLNHAWCEEIAINRPGEIWQRLRAHVDNHYWVRHDAPEIDQKLLLRLCHSAAAVLEIPNFSPYKTPFVFGDLPGGHRFAAGIGPNVQYNDPEDSDNEGGVFISLRRFVRQSRIDFSSYGITPGDPIRKTVRSHFTRETDPSDPFSQIMNSITRGDHILLSGPMGAGKTSFLAEIIRMVQTSYRVITIEDTRELVIPGPNRIHFVLSRTAQVNDITYNHVINAIKRMTPDIIMAGEISSDNASAIWELMKIGYGSFYTTVHASSAAEAIETFTTCMAHASNNPSLARDQKLQDEVRAKVRVIQIERDHIHGRRVSEII